MDGSSRILVLRLGLTGDDHRRPAAATSSGRRPTGERRAEIREGLAGEHARRHCRQSAGWSVQGDKVSGADVSPARVASKKTQTARVNNADSTGAPSPPVSTDKASARAWSVQAHVPSAGSSLRTRNRRARPPRASSVKPEASAGGSIARDAGDGVGSPNTRTPHPGYHRIEGFPRPFFEGWYFRVTLPEIRDNLSLIYHVYDPDFQAGASDGARARRCARREGSTSGANPATWRGSPRRRTSSPCAWTTHTLRAVRSSTRWPAAGASIAAGCVSGTRSTILPCGSRRNSVSEVRWDFSAEPVAGYGDRGGRRPPRGGCRLSRCSNRTIRSPWRTAWRPVGSRRTALESTPQSAGVLGKELGRRGFSQQVVLAPVQLLPRPTGFERHRDGW